MNDLELENPVATMRDTMINLLPESAIEPLAEGWAPGMADLITLPQQRSVKDVAEHHVKAIETIKPIRRTGCARFTELQSIIDWTNRFKDEDSALFANPDPNSPSLCSVINYHQSGPMGEFGSMGDPKARKGDHRATYNFPLSDEWKAWMDISGQGLDKDDMGEFIEANAKDIFDPTPAILSGRISDKNEAWEDRLIETAMKIEGRYGQLTQLLQMSKRFQIHETSDLTVTTNRDTGEAEVQFLNEHKTADGQKVNIPNLIIIAIPVFRGGAPYRMPVRFRYRKRGANISFILSIYNPEKAFEAAFKEAVTEATEKTDLPTFFGTPES